MSEQSKPSDDKPKVAETHSRGKCLKCGTELESHNDFASILGGSSQIYCPESDCARYRLVTILRRVPKEEVL